MDVVFDIYKREGWLKIISEKRMISDDGGSKDVFFPFPMLPESELKSFHIASLSCLIEYFNKSGYRIFLDRRDKVSKLMLCVL